MTHTAPDRSSRLAAVLCIIAVVALGHTGKMVLVPGILCVFLALFFVSGQPVITKPRLIGQLILAIPFAFWWEHITRDKMVFVGFVPISNLCVLGMYTVAVGISQLLSLRNGGSIYQALGCAVLAMGLAGTAKNGDQLYTVCLWLFMPTLLWCIQEIMHKKTGISWRYLPWVRYTIIIILAVVVQKGVETALLKASKINENAFQRFVIGLSPRLPASYDHATRRLGSISTMWLRSDMSAVQLRVFGTNPVEYMRGAVFDTYKNGVWSNTQRSDITVKPTGTYSGRNLFCTETQPSDDPVATVYPTHAVAGTFFLPLGTSQLGSYNDTVTYEIQSRIFHPKAHAGGGYCYYPAQGSLPPHAGADLLVPEELAKPLKQFCVNVLTDEMSDSEKAYRLEAYFAKNFTYQIGLRLTTEKDPVLEFLEDIGKGHCEYFAASTVLLLRSQGIPARYVTGFVCRERGMGNDLWIVRQRHAHAWVEAYLADLDDWTIVEPTPPSEELSAISQNKTASLSDWLSAQWHRATHLAIYGGLRALFSSTWTWFKELLVSLPIMVWMVLLLGGLAWMFRQRMKQMLTKKHIDPVSARVNELRAKMARAEKTLARYGVVRQPSMTVKCFLKEVSERSDVPKDVLDDAVALLKEYHRYRFRMESNSDENIAAH